MVSCFFLLKNAQLYNVQRKKKKWGKSSPSFIFCSCLYDFTRSRCRHNISAHLIHSAGCGGARQIIPYKCLSKRTNTGNIIIYNYETAGRVETQVTRNFFHDKTSSCKSTQHHVIYVPVSGEKKEEENNHEISSEWFLFEGDGHLFHLLPESASCSTQKSWLLGGWPSPTPWNKNKEENGKKKVLVQ